MHRLGVVILQMMVIAVVLLNCVVLTVDVSWSRNTMKHMRRAFTTLQAFYTQRYTCMTYFRICMLISNEC